MELVPVRQENDLSGDALVVMKAKLGVVRALCEPSADGLEDSLPSFDLLTARALLGLLEAMLFNLTPVDRANFRGLLKYYRRAPNEALASSVVRASGMPEFLGVEHPLLTETCERLRARPDDPEPRRLAGRIGTHRLAELCAFGLDLRTLKRPALRLVHSR